jgi:hypothetical protein
LRVERAGTPGRMARSSYLTVYLNDHLAGSNVAVELVRRASRAHAGTDLGTFLSSLAAEIETDRRELRQIMASVGARPHRVKLAGAWLGEKVRRLKFNGRLLRPSPLTPFIELETLAIGIHGKFLLWGALIACAAELGLSATRLEELSARADRQHTEVEGYRIEAGRRALRS